MGQSHRERYYELQKAEQQRREKALEAQEQAKELAQKAPAKTFKDDLQGLVTQAERIRELESQLEEARRQKSEQA